MRAIQVMRVCQLCRQIYDLYILQFTVRGRAVQHFKLHLSCVYNLISVCGKQEAVLNARYLVFVVIRERLVCKLVQVLLGYRLYAGLVLWSVPAVQHRHIILGVIDAELPVRGLCDYVRDKRILCFLSGPRRLVYDVYKPCVRAVLRPGGDIQSRCPEGRLQLILQYIRAYSLPNIVEGACAEGYDAVFLMEMPVSYVQGHGFKHQLLPCVELHAELILQPL